MATLREEREEWDLLLKSPAWVKLDALIAEQIAGRINEVVLTALPSADAVFGQEFMKGEIAALQLIARLPGLEIERLNADIEALNKEENTDVPE